MNKTAFDPEAFVREMLEDNHAQAFFTRFDAKPDSIEKFLTAYSEHKANVHEKGDRYTRHIREMEEVHKEMAWKAYGAILNRKIFIAQCRWRAEQLELKDIGISYDFWCWGEYPYHCPFIDEVTAAELEMMKGFLLRPEFRRWDLELDDNWQDYEDYALPAEDKVISWNEYPSWYAYCDAHGSDPDWRSLPDIRGRKEHVYLDAGRNTGTTRSAASTSKKKSKKTLRYEDEELLAIELANLLGDSSTAQHIRDKIDAREGQVHPDVDTTLMYFQAFHNEKIPVRANENWGEGINMAAEQFFARHAAAVLEETHEEYLYRKANDLLEEEEKNVYKFIVDSYREIILQGRIKKGEPGDLNF